MPDKIIDVEIVEIDARCLLLAKDELEKARKLKIEYNKDPAIMFCDAAEQARTHAITALMYIVQGALHFFQEQEKKRTSKKEAI